MHDGDDWASASAGDVDSDSSGDSPSDRDQNWTDFVTIQDASEKQLVTLLEMVDDIGSTVRISEEASIQAAEFVVEAWQRNLTHGRQFNAIAAGGVYASCRKTGQARPFTAVAEAAGVDVQKVQHGYRVLANELPITVNPPGASGYVGYLADELGLSNEAERVVSTALSEQMAVGGNPSGVAAASLYLYSTEEEFEEGSLTLRRAAEASGVTKETVWRRAQTLRNSGFLDSLSDSY